MEHDAMEHDAYNIIKKAVNDNVTELDLSFTNINKISKIITELTNLKSLHINVVDLREIPEYLSHLSNLQELDLSGNRIQEIPEHLSCLKRLQILKLHLNNIYSIPKHLSLLPNLKILDLGVNDLLECQEYLGGLTSLRVLNISENNLEKVPEHLEKLLYLQQLKLNGNDLQTISEHLSSLENLQELDISSNNIKEIPKHLVKLKNLRVLNLSKNNIKEIPDYINLLDGLVELDISSNNISSIPIELGKLPNLKRLHIVDNPLIGMPEAIIKQGDNAVLSWLKEQAKGQKQEWISKMILVGEGGVGKTSILNILRGLDYNPKERTTFGLDVHQLDLQHPKKSDITMYLKAWDFGGQHVLHATHQFFLTDRSLFILVWNARLGYEQGKLFYWLDVIKARAPEAPVIIVATHTEDWPAKFPLAEIRSRYPQVIEKHISVSCPNKTGFDELEMEIEKAAAGLPLMGYFWPAKWLDVADAFEELSKQKKYIFLNELKEVFKNHEIKEDDYDILRRYLHDLGYILNFTDNPDLAKYIILDAEWVGTKISMMLASEKIEKGLGIFTREHMDEIWPDDDPPAHELFLHLMEQFDLSYRTLERDDISIVVEKLAMDPPEASKDYQTLWVKKKNKPGITMKFYLQSSLPPGIPTWFIARSHRFTTKKHWRYGGLFQDNNRFGLIRAFDHDRYVELCVRGDIPINFFMKLRDTLEFTFKRYEGLSIERKVPCYGNINRDPCPHEFEVDQLEMRLKRVPPKNLIECPECLEDIDVRKLLYGLVPDTMDEVKKDIKVIKETSIDTNVDVKLLQKNLSQLTEFLQREFLKLQHIEQEKLRSSFPRIFTIRPIGSKNWLKNIAGQNLELQLYCEAPGCWHSVEDGGSYKIKMPAGWLRSLVPYLGPMVEAMKYAAPLVGPAAGHITGGLSMVLENDIKLMEELIKKLPDIKIGRGEEILDDEGLSEFKHYDPRMREMPAMEVLQKLLNQLDPKGENYGLKKVLTKEGHIVWVCEKHYEQYHKYKEFRPLADQ